MVRMRSTSGKKKRKASGNSVGSSPIKKDGEVQRRMHYVSRESGVYKGKVIIEKKVKEKKKAEQNDEVDKKTTEETASIPEVK